VPGETSLAWDVKTLRFGAGRNDNGSSFEAIVPSSVHHKVVFLRRYPGHRVKATYKVQVVELTTKGVQQGLTGDDLASFHLFQLHCVGGLTTPPLGNDQGFQSLVNGHCGGRESGRTWSFLL
jgi:hypothetical protein